VPVEINTVEVSTGNNPCWCGVWSRVVVQAVPVGRYHVVYCVAVNM